MRGAYLVSSNDRNKGRCRGGVGSDYDYGPMPDYALEIGNDCYADTTMMSLCVHIDEIMEYLELSRSPIARMLLQSIRQEIKRLDESLAESRK